MAHNKVAQEAAAQDVVAVDASSFKKETNPTNGMGSVKVSISHQTSQSLYEDSAADPQDNHLWDCAVANSMDAIRELADKALADKRAGRTRKITI